jgi:hypothetical protein
MLRLAPLKIFAAAALLSAVGAVAASSRAEGDETLRELSRYREWARVRDVPVAVLIDLSAAGG